MNIKQHVLISLEERHAINILSGAKQVELRRRTMHVEPGSIIWLYVKKPIGAVIGYAVVGATYSAAPIKVWRKFEPVTGLSRDEFLSYFEGATSACAMGISAPKRLMRPIPLDELRAASPGFHPPQFYCRIEIGSSMGACLSQTAMAASE